MKRLFLLALLAAPATSNAQSPDCRQGQLAQGLRNIETWYQNRHPRDLYVAQLLLREGNFPDIATDGQWGPATSAAFCQMLTNHVAIFGQMPVERPAETPDFIDWLAALNYALDNGGEIPD
ncbi:MAG TPA: hypothetical protein ENJ52_12955 [Aliiroseovarius sp.]|nr:hypothetical protein [Aliiroseovarius sp.]